VPATILLQRASIAAMYMRAIAFDAIDCIRSRDGSLDFAALGYSALTVDRKAPLVLSIVIAFAIRLALVGLFFPFSALDKVLDFDAAVAQARESCSTRGQAIALIAIGLFVEVFMSLAILTGICDRLGAFVLSG
jgi:DoxX